MRVRELISESAFRPGPGRRSDVAPRVTVTLPTFRRGDSGLLARAIDSLLAQTFTDFELIIIDDASVDSTADVIAAAMRRDDRVSVIRHARNIGLPAVSEYEAYRVARGDLFVFAFDDTVFAPDAIERLVAASSEHPGAMVVGSVTLFLRDDSGSLVTSLLGTGVGEADLAGGNVIPNNAVIMPRAILDDVGLYDPHISLARLCDYDLWLRVRGRHPIRFVDIQVGEEHGPATTDSIGTTYHLDEWTADDRMRQPRNETLRPDAFGDVDVFSTGDFASARSRREVAELAAAHRSTRPWLSEVTAPETARARVPRVLVVCERIDTSVQLVFGAIREQPGLHVRIVESARRPKIDVVAADALVLVHTREDRVEWVEVARGLGIPVFSSLDGHLSMLPDEAENDGQLGPSVVAHLASAEGAARFVEFLEPLLAPDDSDARRLRRYALWLERRLAAQRDSRADADRDAPAWAAQATHRLVRNSRRMNAFRAAGSSPLAAHGRGDATEVSEPLQLVPYLEYRVVLDAGSYSSARVELRGAGEPDDRMGLELVDTAGVIVARASAPLPVSADVQHADFHFGRIDVAGQAEFAARLFTNSRHQIEVLERVSRGRFGLRRPHVSPVLEFGD